VKKSARFRSPGTKTTRNRPWSMRSRSQWNRISKDFDVFGVTVLLARPIAHSLSYEMTIAGRGCSSLARIWRSSTVIRTEAKRAAHSAFAMKDTTTGILVEWAETGWLMGESSGRRVGWKEQEKLR
jgi:hypothetical protein